MNTKTKVIALLTVLLLLVSAPTVALAASADVLSIETSGFTVANFDQNTNYYLCYPTSFSNIKINSVTTRLSKPSISISVEQYCGKVSNAKCGDTLDVGYGRAKITVTVNTNNKVYTYLLVLSDPNQGAYYYAFPTGTTKVYKTTSTSSTVIKSVYASNTAASMLYCIGTSGSWTKVQCTNSGNVGQVGWIQTKYLSRGFNATGMSSGYASKISALKKAHPNWTFEYAYMGTDIDSYAKTVQDQIKSNAGKTVDIDTIKSYMDPMNYLDEKNIFAFLDLTQYNTSTFSQKGVESMWVEKSGASVTKAQAVSYILEASKSITLNPYFIASRAAIESGYGTSKLATGGVTGYAGYYNFYGIGAYDSNPSNGAAYAKKRGWDSPMRAIVEGANWIKDQYVDRGQKTPYLFRFFTYRSHSYMTDLTAPKSEASKLYQGYSASGTLDKKLHFIIPVYDFRYSDVSPTAWYYNYVYKATELKLFDGIGDGLFAPDDSMTRAQFVTVLSRIAGVDTSKYSTNRFKDVGIKDWYYHAVCWASSVGIADGMSPDTFEPDTALSREMLCTMLARFSNYMRVTMPAGSVSQYKDAAKISGWAKAAVGQCTKAGLVAGIGNGYFDPASPATRAQGAKILSIYYETYIAE